MAVDNRDFADHFELDGSNVYVEDKRIGELKDATAKTASQVSITDQYVPLQDTDGNIVKISPASFQEALRVELGKLLANNDKGTTISGIPALSGSGNSLDFGSITPANLASVLGVIERLGAPSIGVNQIDWDNVYTSDNYIADYNDADGTLGYPISGTAGTYIIIRGYIFCFAYFGKPGVYIGTFYHASISSLVKAGL